MSAFVVGKVHVDYLIQAGLSRMLRPGLTGPLRWYHNGQSGQLDHTNADAIGRLLWGENLRSVAALYPSDTSGKRPGPCGLTDEAVEAYAFRSNSNVHVDPVQVLSAVACLEYQSCEHPEWEASEARAILEALTKAAIRALPGYENAEWEITNPPNRPVPTEAVHA